MGAAQSAASAASPGSPAASDAAACGTDSCKCLCGRPASGGASRRATKGLPGMPGLWRGASSCECSPPLAAGRIPGGGVAVLIAGRCGSVGELGFASFSRDGVVWASAAWLAAPFWRPAAPGGNKNLGGPLEIQVGPSQNRIDWERHRLHRRPHRLDWRREPQGAPQESQCLDLLSAIIPSPPLVPLPLPYPSRSQYHCHYRTQATCHSHAIPRTSAARAPGGAADARGLERRGLRPGRGAAGARSLWREGAAMS